MGRQKIKLTENELRGLIKESINKVINEDLNNNLKSANVYKLNK